MDVLHEFDRLWKPLPSVTDAAIRPLPPPMPEIVNELAGPVQSEAEAGAIPGSSVQQYRPPGREQSKTSIDSTDETRYKPDLMTATVQVILIGFDTDGNTICLIVEDGKVHCCPEDTVTSTIGTAGDVVFRLKVKLTIFCGKVADIEVISEEEGDRNEENGDEDGNSWGVGVSE